MFQFPLQLFLNLLLLLLLNNNNNNNNNNNRIVDGMLLIQLI